MNRNVESHFSLVPHAEINRSRFDRSQDIKMSFNVGELIPFFVDEVLPGDTFQIETSKVVRLQTLLTPLMDNMYLDTYFFFVPNRLVWTHWKDFMGENTQSAWLPEVTYSIPQFLSKQSDNTDVGFRTGSVWDYLGVPVGVSNVSVNALPYRAYCMIYNEFFRDENLQDPLNTYLGDSNTLFVANQDAPFKANKYHDYFTSCLPGPLKGQSVYAPISNFNLTNINYNPDHRSDLLKVDTLAQNYGVYPTSGLNLGVANNSTVYGLRSAAVEDTGGEERISVILDSNNSSWFAPRNLFVNVGNIGVDIMSLRNAFQVQKLLECDARSGTRYTEVIKGHFNVTSPDSRLQRPEYLGGNRVPLSIHQITNQSQGETDFLGDLGAMSLTTDRHSDFQQSFTEHGYIIGLCCVRYDHSYPQGLERFWNRKNRFDFYWPELANISEQSVLNSEIYLQGTSADNEVFGYQEAWADYRYKPNRVSGEMRPGVSNSLASWHLSDYYTSQPYLSSAWIKEDKNVVDRVLAVTSSNADQVFCDIYVKNFTTRPMPTYSVPGLADHH